MTAKIEFYFDFLSPYSYLAYRIASKHFGKDYLFILKPVSLPHIISLSGNSPPAGLQVRGEFLKKDLQRSAEFYGIVDEDGAAMVVPKQFPFDTRNDLYSLAMLIEEDSEDVDMFIMSTWTRIFHKGDISVGPEPSDKARWKAAVMKNTQDALKLGAYGVPFWRITDDHGRSEVFFGSDRFHHIAKFLGIDPIRFLELDSKL